MMVNAGRWKNLTMTERWLILNGLAALQARRRDTGVRFVHIAHMKIHLDTGTITR
ncbi:hypothetical protein [Alicyclobacillus ferrooxydans]|uniref:hypothetical protein n=1 Tax=Alicyclobacillus ferrooxydans TaxID=471514 RepID=UPI000AC7D75B|nr:hypothetical protein [Alicyclobacillus ferrooxydans]